MIDKYEEPVEIKEKSTKVLRCTCHSVFQDKTRGKGLRVHNKTRDSWRCTVCGAVK